MSDNAREGRDRIGPITYDRPLPWRIRVAFRIAPELRAELAHWGDQVRRLSASLEVMRDV